MQHCGARPPPCADALGGGVQPEGREVVVQHAGRALGEPLKVLAAGGVGGGCAVCRWIKKEPPFPLIPPPGSSSDLQARLGGGRGAIAKQPSRRPDKSKVNPSSSGHTIHSSGHVCGNLKHKEIDGVAAMGSMASQPRGPKSGKATSTDLTAPSTTKIEATNPYGRPWGATTAVWTGKRSMMFVALGRGKGLTHTPRPR